MFSHYFTFLHSYALLVSIVLPFDNRIGPHDVRKPASTPKPPNLDSSKHFLPLQSIPDMMERLILFRFVDAHNGGIIRTADPLQEAEALGRTILNLALRR